MGICQLRWLLFPEAAHLSPAWPCTWLLHGSLCCLASQGPPRLRRDAPGTKRLGKQPSSHLDGPGLRSQPCSATPSSVTTEGARRCRQPQYPYLYNGERHRSSFTSTVACEPRCMQRVCLSDTLLSLNSAVKKGPSLPWLPARSAPPCLPLGQDSSCWQKWPGRVGRLLPAPTQLHSKDTGCFIPGNNCSLGSQVPHLLPPPLPLRWEETTTPIRPLRCPLPYPCRLSALDFAPGLMLSFKI